MREIKLENIIINKRSPPILIAEAGVNHEGDIEKAKKMIEEAARCGSAAIKFQSYKADKLTIKDSPLYWSDGEHKSQYDVFKKTDKFDKKEFNELFRYCKKNKIIFLSTAFDEESADMLDEIGMCCFKIASADITNYPLIKHIAEKGKPIILSTGASTIKEIKEAVNLINRKNLFDIIILHCILCYPTPYDQTNLSMISSIIKNFPEYPVGFSDHTMVDESYLVDAAAVTLGAKVIEKHFTLDKNLPGSDHYHSADPRDLYKIIRNINFTYRLLGENIKKPVECEEKALRYARRSLVTKTDIPKGTKIEGEMIISKRPGTGIPPRYIDKVIGMVSKYSIKEDTPLEWRMLRHEKKKGSSNNSGSYGI